MYRITPISIYDIPAVQAWLEDQAARGRYLENWNAFLCGFSQEKPRAVRYRLEPLGKRERRGRWVTDGSGPDRERLEAYRAMGWEYVCLVGGTCFIWRCDDPAAPELHTDPEVEAQAVDRFRRQVRILNAVVLLSAAVIAVLLMWLWRVNPAPRLLSYARTDTPWIARWVIPPLGAVMLGRLVYENYVLRRLLRFLRAGVGVEHRAPWRGKVALNLLFWMLYLLFFLQVWANAFSPYPDKSHYSMAQAPLPAAWVSLTGLDPTAGQTEGAVTRGRGWVAADHWNIDEDGGLVSRPGIHIWTQSLWGEYFRLRQPDRAADLAHQLRRERGGAWTALDGPGEAEAWACPEDSWGRQRLVLRLGDRVLSVSYVGPAELTDHLAGYAAALAAF